MHQNLMEVKLSVSKLKKAAPLWWIADWHTQLRKSELTETEQSSVLLSLLTLMYPENVARRANKRWYAAGHRARGESWNRYLENDALSYARRGHSTGRRQAATRCRT